MHKTRIDLSEEIRKDVSEILNQRLSDSIAMKLQAKHAHWNVKGPNFFALHELFDKVAGMLEGHSDEIAERISALGGTPNGRVGSLAQAKIPTYPSDLTSGRGSC